MTAPAKRWYVTASHRTVNRKGVDPSAVPFGTSHVREVGGALTACGKPAANWPIFWDVAFDVPGDFCPECRRTARTEELQAPRPHRR